MWMHEEGGGRCRCMRRMGISEAGITVDYRHRRGTGVGRAHTGDVQMLRGDFSCRPALASTRAEQSTKPCCLAAEGVGVAVVSLVSLVVLVRLAKEAGDFEADVVVVRLPEQVHLATGVA